jgi:hypothetical protein
MVGVDWISVELEVLEVSYHNALNHPMHLKQEPPFLMMRSELLSHAHSGYRTHAKAERIRNQIVGTEQTEFDRQWWDSYSSRDINFGDRLEQWRQGSTERLQCVTLVPTLKNTLRPFTTSFFGGRIVLLVPLRPEAIAPWGISQLESSATTFEPARPV